MSRVVIDASVAVKWVVDEDGTPEALTVLAARPLASPDLLLAECANILWKKVRRAELTEDEAIMAARLLQRADIEILPTRALMETATRLAIELDHPAHDCIYLALARQNGWPFVTADDRLRRKLTQPAEPRFDGVVLSMVEAAAAA